MNEIRFFEVGGAVRDKFLGLPVKDVDFTVVAPSFEAMRQRLVDDGFKIYQERPEFVTIRAGVPQNHKLRERVKDADFVLARKDGTYTDGRRPDSVEPGTLHDDLARRDFTINAIAICCTTGAVIDPFGGREDLHKRILKFVGNPQDRIREDGLRVLRALRFVVTKYLDMDPLTRHHINSNLAADMLLKVSIERVREELERMLAFDTPCTLLLLDQLPVLVRHAIFRDGLRFSATLKE